MTENDAKEKWCPLARVAMVHCDAGNEFIGAINRAAVMEAEVNCIGSDCMAWRKAMGNPRYGYCGAFGKPDFT